MSKETNIREDLKNLRQQRRRQAFYDSPFVQGLKGLWIFAEGSALVVTSLFSIYQGRYGHYPAWSRDVLMVAGVLVVVPAAILLSKFFRQVGRS